MINSISNHLFWLCTGREGRPRSERWQLLEEPKSLPGSWGKKDDYQSNTRLCSNVGADSVDTANTIGTQKVAEKEIRSRALKAFSTLCQPRRTRKASARRLRGAVLTENSTLEQDGSEFVGFDKTITDGSGN